MNYYVYDMFLRMRILRAAASRSSMLTARSLAAQSAVVLFLDSMMPVTPIRWYFIMKLVDRCVDLTTPLSHDQIRCSINVQELIQRVAL